MDDEFLDLAKDFMGLKMRNDYEEKLKYNLIMKFVFGKKIKGLTYYEIPENAIPLERRMQLEANILTELQTLNRKRKNKKYERLLEKLDEISNRLLEKLDEIIESIDCVGDKC